MLSNVAIALQTICKCLMFKANISTIVFLLIYEGYLLNTLNNRNVAIVLHMVAKCLSYKANISTIVMFGLRCFHRFPAFVKHTQHMVIYPYMG